MITSQIADEAGAWDARLRAPGCTESDRAAFAAWREAHPDHGAAFERLQQFVALLRTQTSRADVCALRDAALAVTHRRRRRRRFAIAAAVAALAVGATLWTVRPERAGNGEYETSLGQQFTVSLQDGSSVRLNARSRIKVQFDKAQRRVELIDGQAIFQVAKNPQRPFVVSAGGREIVALGTAFDVRLEPATLKVTLIEGRVSVSNHKTAVATRGPATAMELHRRTDVSEILATPGQQLVASLASRGAAQNGPATMRIIDVEEATGWRNGRVFLEDLSLPDAITEMNRYSPVQIAISDADASLSRLRVNGMFRAGEQEAFVAALEEYFPIQVARSEDTQIILTARRP